MSNTVAGAGRRQTERGSGGLYSARGSRKYLNQAERGRALAAMGVLDEDQQLFALVLAWTGARVSEVLALNARSMQVEASLVSLQTLKRRKPHTREVPIPPGLMQRLERSFSLRRRQADPYTASLRLWPRHRITGWRVIKHVMMVAQVTGVAACPRGLRHGFGVGTLQAGVPMNLTQRWMGHSRISTTAIYADACGPEEIAFAQLFWQASERRDELTEVEHAAPTL